MTAGSVLDPATIANEHIRAHAEEGRLFRTVIERAAAVHHLTVKVFVEKELVRQSARLLDEAEDTVKSRVSALGRNLGGPWRAEEKAATLAAWTMLT